MRHQDVWEVLPWFVNGSLEDRELAHVEGHLTVCEECRREASELRQFAGIMVGGGEDMVTPDEAFPELMSRIEEAGRRESVRWSRWSRPDGWPHRFLVAFSTGQFLRPALVASFLVVVLLAVLLWRQSVLEPPATFRTLSSPVVEEAGGLRVRLVFGSDVDEGTMRALLLEVGGQIVGGPSPYGVYTVELPPQENPSVRDKLLEVIRARAEVEFLEPVANE
jgi:hypothetical protein